VFIAEVHWAGRLIAMKSLATVILFALLALAAAASAHPPAHVNKKLHLAQFSSPSENIGCVVVSGGARCDIAHRDWSPPPRPANCPLDYGQGIAVGRHGHAGFVCAGDTALDPNGPTLAYGRKLDAFGFTCRSAVSGMTCASNRSGHGFFISIQRYRIF
jgi:hypothetical protein